MRESLKSNLTCDFLMFNVLDEIINQFIKYSHSGKFFLLLNSCSNFLIYVMCSPKFRRLLTKQLGKLFRQILHLLYHYPEYLFAKCIIQNHTCLLSFYQGNFKREYIFYICNRGTPMKGKSRESTVRRVARTKSIDSMIF